MAPPTYKLYAPPGSFRAFAPLIVAEYNGIHIEVAAAVGGELEATITTKSPTGKAPILEIHPGGRVLFSSHAVARYVAGLRPDTGLLGSGSPQDRARIDAWLDWVAQDVELPACVWFYPAVGYMADNPAATAKAKDDLAAALKVLDASLSPPEGVSEGGGVDNSGCSSNYLVGAQITLADIVVACTLIYPFKLVCDEEYLRPYHNVLAWFTTCVTQPEFVAVVGDVEPRKQPS